MRNITAATTITNTTTTEDDGYTYPDNATTAEEKAAIDAQEYKARVDAGRPGQ